jgi:long-chain fatty acid transport protein
MICPGLSAFKGKEVVVRLFVVFVILFAIVSLPVPALATNGYQLIAIGANQKSMAGAVTAAPQDAMTAISNPAGIGRIGNRADFSMEAFFPVRSVDFTSLQGERTEGGSELYGIPSMGWVAPAFGRDDVFFGGGMFATSGLGVDYGQSIFLPGQALDQMASAPPGTFEDVTFDGYSVIQFWKMAPAVAWNVNEQLSLGFSLNLDYQSLTMRQVIRDVPFWNDPGDPTAGITQANVSLDLGRPTSQFGYGATVGFLYDVHELVTLGGSYASKQYFSDAEFRVGAGDVFNFNGAMGAPGIYKLDLEFPQMLAVGMAVRPLEGLLVDVDVKWINWSATHESVELSGPHDAFDTNGDLSGDASSTALDFGWDDQTVLALGAQYLVNDRLTLQAGFNTATAPIDEADVFNNLILPAVVEKHVTFGFHYYLGEHWGIGGAFMSALEETLAGEGDVPAGFQLLTPFSADSNAEASLEETSMNVQLSYRF